MSRGLRLFLSLVVGAKASCVCALGAWVATGVITICKFGFDDIPSSWEVGCQMFADVAALAGFVVGTRVMWMLIGRLITDERD